MPTVAMSESNGFLRPEHSTDGQMSSSDDLLDEEVSLRPANVDADVRDMMRRKRVDAILNSSSFRDELDRLIECGALEAPSVSGCVQHITDILGVFRTRQSVKTDRYNAINAISDFKPAHIAQISRPEQLARCKLASFVRLMELHGWFNSMEDCITLRISQDYEHFLINSSSLLTVETSASTLLMVDMQGTVLYEPLAERDTTTCTSPRSTPTHSSGVAVTQNGARDNHLPGTSAFRAIHAAVHANRPDLRCVLYVTSVCALTSVSCMSVCADGREGCADTVCLQSRLSHHAALLAPLVTVCDTEQQVSEALGLCHQVVFVRGCGVVCAASCVEELYSLCCHLVAACDIQLRVGAHLTECRLLNKELCAQLAETHSTSLVGAGTRRFASMMRVMDNWGYRTGYVFTHSNNDPHVPSRSVRQHQSDVEYPPTVLSQTVPDSSDVYQYCPLKQALAAVRCSERNRWMNSPNAYQKIELTETGTNDPKKITKWVADNSSNNCGASAVKMSNLQFVPKNTNPREFKILQRQIKDNRRTGDISAGPQSLILDGVSWEEANKQQQSREEQSEELTGRQTPHRTHEQIVLVGAASKGIIQRDFQHHANLYKTPYTKNPFDRVTDEDLNAYKREIEGTEIGGGSDAANTTVTSVSQERPPNSTGHSIRFMDTVSVKRQSNFPQAEHAQCLDLSTATTASDLDEHVDTTLNDTETDTVVLSHTDQEDLSISDASKKDKKKKRGLRTPSFLKKKKDKRREKCIETGV